MKNEPRSKVDPLLTVCGLYLLISIVLLLMLWGITSLMTYGMTSIAHTQFWKSAILAGTVLVSTGWLWLAANTVCIMVATVTPTEALPKWHAGAKRWGLWLLRKYLEWLIDLRRLPRDLDE